MSGMAGYLVAFGCIFAINLLPAFGPPTWAVLVLFKVNMDLAAVPLVLGGAPAAAAGRLVLAMGSRRLRGRFSARRLEGLAAAQGALAGNRRRAAGGLALFAVSPLPSAQLFVAAGLMTVPLLPLTAAFFAGRLVSYSLYVGGSSLAQDNMGSVLTEALSSPTGLAMQVAMLAGVVALVRIDWARLLSRRADRSATGASNAGQGVHAPRSTLKRAENPPQCAGLHGRAASLERESSTP